MLIWFNAIKLLQKQVGYFIARCGAIFCFLWVGYVHGQVQVKRFTCEPVPGWVKQYPKPILRKDYELDLVLVHKEHQYNHLTKEVYKRYFYYVRTIEGLNQIRSYEEEYEPDYQNFHLNKVNIHRKETLLALNTQLHVEFKIQGKQIGGERYDDDAKVSIYFNQAQVGDLIEIAFTIKGAQPDVHGALSFHFYPNDDDLRGSCYCRVLASARKSVFYKALNYDVKPVQEVGKMYTSLEFIFSKEDTTISPVVPDWHLVKRHIYCYDHDSWQSYVQLSLKNFRLEEPVSPVVRNKVQALTKGENALPDKVNRIFNYLQEEVQYLDYGMIDPKRPETVIRQGFGDCKSKSLLAIKMLECLRVEAWPVLVDSDGLDERLVDVYSAQTTDHCVLEYVLNGDTLLFDSTRDPQKGDLSQKFVSDFRYGLRLRKDTRTMTRLKEHRDQKTTIVASFSPKNTDYDNGQMNWLIKFEGDIANQTNARFKEQGIQAVYDNLAQARNYHSFLPLYPEDHYTKYTFNESRPISELTVKAESSRILSYEGADSVAFFPSPLYEWMEVGSRKKLGLYFTLPDFVKTEQTFKIAGYEGMGFVADTITFEKDWIKFHKKTWLQGDTIFATYSTEILKADLDSSRYEEVVEDIKYLRENMRIPLKRQSAVEWEQNSQERAISKLLVWFAMLSFIVGSLSFIVWKVVRHRKAKKAALEHTTEKALS